MTTTVPHDQDVTGQTFTAPSVRAALRAALADVNAAFDALSNKARERYEIVYDGLDQELDAAIRSGDRDRALAAIRAWRGHWLSEFEKAVSA